jgi:ubiquinone biosynthesis protein
VPKIIWEASAQQVLTMGWVDGVPASDIDALKAAGHDFPQLAQRLLQLFLTLALRDGFFHADMHQGNLLIQNDGTIVAIDLGICGRLDEDSRRFLAEILHGFITRDYKKLAEVHIEAGYVPAHHDVHEFAQALRAVGEPIRDRDADEISMGRLLAQLFQITERFDMVTQPQLLLLQKTMVTVEGVARSFDPKVNIWDAGEPIVADWLRRQIGPQAVLNDMRDNAGRTLRALKRLPDTLAQAERGAAALEAMAEQAAQKDGQSHKAKPDRLARALGLAALLAAAAAAALSLI